jgi:E3 ubiquitin-protein ligase HUWE1
VAHYVRGRAPGLLLPTAHLVVLHAALADIAALDAAAPDVDALTAGVLDRPDALLAAMDAICGPCRGLQTSDILRELAPVLDRAIERVLRRVSVNLATERIGDIGANLTFLKHLIASPRFPALFKKILADPLIELVGSHLRRAGKFFGVLCELLASLQADIPETGVQLISLILLSARGRHLDSALSVAARLPSAKREALVLIAERVFGHLDFDDLDALATALPTIIAGFPGLALAWRPKLLQLLVRSFEAFTPNRLPLIALLLDQLLPKGAGTQSRFVAELSAETPVSSLRIPRAVISQREDVWQIIADNADLIKKLVSTNWDLLDSTFKFLVAYPGMLEVKEKLGYFRSKQETKINRGETLKLKVRHDHILDDSFIRIIGLPPEKLLARLSVSFAGEPGIDAGGLTKQWFEEVARALFAGNFGLFGPTPNRRCSQPLAASAELHDNHCKYFNFAGRIVGRAMIENVPIEAHMTTAFLKQILGRPPALRDLEEIDPDVYHSLLWIQKNVIGDDHDIYFSGGVDEITNREIELRPNGLATRVTDENKHEYVARMVENMLHDRCRDQIAAFLQGFYSLVPLEEIRLFEPSDLDLVICGLPEINVDDFRENCEFVMPYRPDHPVIVRFFNVINRWEKERLGKLLFFMTGSSHVPVGGFRVLRDTRVPLMIQPGGHRDRLAVGRTCANTLDLPEYESEEEMEAKLLYSIYECGSFELA